ncbi:hypothetical protein ACEPAG_9477 [Sanghuangporus baumii]
MLRARLPRRALLGAAAAAVAVGTNIPRGEDLAIYPTPEPQLVLGDSPTELKRRIRHLRIAIEHAVEGRIKDFKDTEEHFIPGIDDIGGGEDATGFELREALGFSESLREDVKKAAEEQGQKTFKAVKGQSKAAIQAAEERGKEAAKKVEETVGKKVEDAKRLV